MPDILGIDHIYVTVSNMERSEGFYDVVMKALGFRKNEFQIDGARHVQYYNRHFGYVLRPARDKAQHNLCTGAAPPLLEGGRRRRSQRGGRKLKAAHIPVSEPGRYPDYASDYFAIYFSDPDGIRLEITNYRQERRQRHDHWKNIEP